MDADTLLVLIYFGLVILGLLDFLVSTDSEEVKQFRRMVESWFRRQS